MDDVKWFSQNVLTYKDKQYSTDNYLRISISSNSEKYQFYNQPTFNISINGQFTKNSMLKIQDAEDLLESFEVALKQFDGKNELVVEKHYQKNNELCFKFILSEVTNERVVSIEIISSSTNSIRIIVPLKPVFQSFLKRLRKFVENYDKICYSLFNKTIFYDSFNIIKQLPFLIKGISSQIVSQIPAQQHDDINISTNNLTKTEVTINDLNRFLGDNMSNIHIPEIEEGKIEEKPKITKIKSTFVTNVLKEDLYNIESKLSSFAVTENPIISLASEFDIALGFKVLDNISDDSIKSLSYLSKLFKEYYSKGYIINGTPIPGGSPTLKFKPKNITDKNVEFAKDILVIIGYIREVRRRMESKLENAYDNRSMLYLFTRCFMDAFCFSYFDSITKDEIVGIVKNRYDYFDSIGFFNRYKQLLDDNNCSPITSRDLVDFAELAYSSINKFPYINELHKILYSKNNVKLPPENLFTLEQIINEIIPVEVSEKMGSDLKDKEVLEKIKEQYKISDEIITFFTKHNKVKIEREKITPLQRWVNKFKQDIPKEYQDKVIQHVKELGFKPFDFSKCKWPLEEFDDQIVKSLYVWDPESDSKMRTNFEYFASLVNNEPMDKSDILILVKSKKDSNEWDAISNFI